MAAGEAKLPATDWILIVDDEFDIISIFKQALIKKGFHVFGFTDPPLALEHFQINVKRYGLVISDLRMPRMNGYEFVKTYPWTYLETSQKLSNIGIRNEFYGKWYNSILQKSHTYK